MKSLIMPRQKPVEDDHFSFDALLIGRLSVINQCVRIEDQNSPTSYLAIWQNDVYAIETSTGIELYHGDHDLIAREGDCIVIGGGEVAASYKEWISTTTIEPIPAWCVGPYWIVGTNPKRKY